MRLIHAVRDLNAATRETGGHQIEVIALHTEGEKRAMFVREADVAYDLGPAANRPYLDHALLERALTQTRADAAWVGWGFVAEDAAFADLCARIGVAFIGPSGEAMRKLGEDVSEMLDFVPGVAAGSTPSRTPSPRPAGSATRSCSRRPRAVGAEASAR